LFVNRPSQPTLQETTTLRLVNNREYQTSFLTVAVGSNTIHADFYRRNTTTWEFGNAIYTESFPYIFTTKPFAVYVIDVAQDQSATNPQEIYEDVGTLLR
jgi:hypothetical protein